MFAKSLKMQMKLLRMHEFVDFSHAIFAFKRFGMGDLISPCDQVGGYDN